MRVVLHDPVLDAPRELRWTLGLNRWGARPPVTRLFAVVSRLGDGPAWYALMALLPLLDGARGVAASLHLAATGLAALVLYRALKRLTRRPRPCARHRAIVAHVPPLDEFSFPSGHTLHAVAFTAVACAWYPPLALLLVPYALLVAASRVVLGLHYPSDVLAAIAIGGALATCSILLAGAAALR
jgi:undecaprenyl-diphosphatase